MFGQNRAFYPAKHQFLACMWHLVTASLVLGREAIWGAARAISSIGREGEMHDRDFDAQLNRASSTMLLVAMLSTWNTVYLDNIVNTLRANGTEIADEHLGHISPLGWQHINLLGRYQFDLTQAYPLQALRPLRRPAG